MDPRRARAIDRIEALCDATDDLRTLRLSLLEEIRRAVPFEAYAWLLTDPETEVGCAPVADVPCLPELPRLIRLKYLTPINRWTGLSRVSSLKNATHERLDRSLVWRALLRDYGVTDVASAVFRDRFGCWAFLELWRIGADGFADVDLAFLEATTRTITAALRRGAAATFRADRSPLPAHGPVVLMLSPELDVKAQTPQTEDYLRLLVPPDGDRRPIPAAAYNVAAQLCALEAGIDRHPPVARVHLTADLWLTLRAARITDGTSDARQDIAVTIERSSPEERLGLFGRASGLSPRESDVLRHLATGADTRDVAQRMFVSEHTVQDHLKSIFLKTGMRTRSSLLAAASGVERLG